MQEFLGTKEMYDVSLKLNHPVDFNNQHFEVNETLLSFKSVEISTLDEVKTTTQATGGYHNIPLINWEVDKEMKFAISNGVLTPVSWAILSNSKIDNVKKKSVPFNEYIKVIENGKTAIATLKYCPNCLNEKMGVQGNPNGEPMPMGRRCELPLKPLPPSKEKYIFCYDGETGEKIKDFQICGNNIIVGFNHRSIYVDYTFDYNDEIKVIEVGNRLFNGFLNLTGKLSVKGENSGQVTTAILEIPKIKLSSSLSIRLGKGYNEATVSDFFFTGYPDENIRREKQSVAKITFLNTELTEDYI